MENLNQLLTSLGINLASSAIYDLIRTFAGEKKFFTEDFKKELVSLIKVENASVKADKIIDFLAQRGDINISGSYIFANESISFKSWQGTAFSFGNGSVSETKKSKISAGQGARIIGKGGAKVVQDGDGNINFFA